MSIVLTDEQLKRVEELSGCFFSAEDITIIMEIDARYKNNDAFIRAAKRGRLINEASIRKSVIDLAIAGSSPAQIAALKLIDQAKLDE